MTNNYWSLDQQTPYGVNMQAQQPETNIRRPAAERRAEIVSTAARIALDEGLERITLRRVADALGVRPGLISHYFPEAEVLVAAAFSHTAAAEREGFFATVEQGPTERLVAFLDKVLDDESAQSHQLWLSARNLSRYNAHLRSTLNEEESDNRDQLSELISSGVADGAFNTTHPERASLLILLIVDALASYTYEEDSPVSPLLREMLFTTAERAVDVPEASLLARSSAPSAPSTAGSGT